MRLNRPNALDENMSLRLREVIILFAVIAAVICGFGDHTVLTKHLRQLCDSTADRSSNQVRFLERRAEHVAIWK